MSTSAPSFAFSARCEIDLQRYSRAALSIPILDAHLPINEKDLIRTDDSPAAGKHTLEKHLADVARRGEIDPSMPLLAVGLRNCLVNLRAPVIQRGVAYAVAGETPERSVRPYFGLGRRNGRIVLDQALGRGRTASEWPEFFCGGIPVLWDGVSSADLFDLMLAEVADHSHLFELPRGKHWLTTPESILAWKQLHHVFTAHVHSDIESAARAMHAEVALITPPLRRATDYLHAVVGSRPDGTLIWFYQHGSLETLGQLALSRGCTRAVCVENSGSVMPTFLPKGLNGDAVSLLRAPNFRPHARTMLIFELPSSQFASKPLVPFSL